MGSRIERDGVGSRTSAPGGGSPTLLLIHGAFSDRSVYGRQVEYFSPRHDVVAVDLRGHGESDQSYEGYSMQGFADDVAHLANELRLRECVVVGHKLGGLVVVELAGRHPHVVAAVATLDSPSLIPGWTTRYAHPFDTEMEGSGFRASLEGFLRRAIHPADDQERGTEAWRQFGLCRPRDPWELAGAEVGSRAGIAGVCGPALVPRSRPARLRSSAGTGALPAGGVRADGGGGALGPAGRLSAGERDTRAVHEHADVLASYEAARSRTGPLRYR